MAPHELAKKPGQSQRERVDAFRGLFSQAIYNNLQFQQFVPAAVWSEAFAVNKELLRKLNENQRSIVFHILPEQHGVEVILVQPKSREVNWVWAMYNEYYRAKLVSAWYAQLASASQMVDRKKAYDKVQAILKQAQQPLGLTEIDGVVLPGMFDLVSPPGSDIQSHLQNMRDLINNKEAVSSPERIQDGVNSLLNELWPIVDEAASAQKIAMNLQSPETMQNAMAGGQLNQD